MENKSFLIVIAILSIAVSSLAQVIDKDGNTYKTVTIGNQMWMVENLKVAHFRNGDPVPEANTAEEWIKSGKITNPAWCYYGNDSAKSKKYGKLYNWYAVNDPRGLAPEGWHIPSDVELTMLTDYLGGENEAGTKMKTTSGWYKKGNGTNESGFAGLPGGTRDHFGIFHAIGSYCSWWSSTESDTNSAWNRNLYFDSVTVLGTDSYKQEGYSIRCLRD
jgi:uncharacterized protein (TIGR02145 family)